MKFFVQVLLLSFSISSQAEEFQSLQKQGLSLFLGLDAGLSLLSTSIDGEESKSGLTEQAKALLSYNKGSYLLDGGIGFANKKISGTRPTGMNGELETRSVFFEFDARWRISNRFLLGPSLLFHFGTDLSQRPTVNPIVLNEPEKGSIFLIGVEGLYDTKLWDRPLRLGLRAETDLNVENRQIFQIMFVAQIGFDLIGGSPEAPTRTAQSESPYISSVGSLVLPNFNFYNDSANPKPHSKRTLNKVADFLSHHQDKYELFDIEGHTNRTGSYGYNMKLSKRRSQHVKNVLAKKGVATTKVSSKGYGFQRPLRDTLPQDGINRRVTLVPRGQNDLASVADEFNALFDER